MQGILDGSILAKQYELEDEASHEGRTRYRRLIQDAVERGDAPYLKPVERFRRHWLTPMTEAVRSEQQECLAGESKTGRGIYGPLVMHEEFLSHPEVLALITIDNVLSVMVQAQRPLPRREMTYAIGREAVALLDYEALRSQDGKALARLTNSIKRLTPKHIRWWVGKNCTLENDRFQTVTMYHLGDALLALLVGVASAGNYSDDFRPALHLFEEPVYREGRRTVKTRAMIRLDESVLDRIEDGHLARESLHPKHLPMLVQPFPWQMRDDGLVEGGYAKVRVPLIFKMRKTHRALLKRAKLATVLEGVSSVSHTPYRINARLLEVAKAVGEAGGGELGVPKVHDIERPPYPPGFDGSKGKDAWANVDEATVKEWKRSAAEVYSQNIALKGQRETFNYRMRIMDRFAGVDRFWLPCQLDFRGRCYAVPQGINYQGDDVCRGMLEYADGRQRTALGDRYLRIHAANCFGIDKVSFDERVKWVDDHLTDIEHAINHPMKDEFWRAADKPFQFLAACYALAEDGECHLPTQWDGSCNGLQWYTAIGRDENSAPLVNMVPAEKPSDIYTAVAASVIRLMEGIVDSKDQSKVYVGWYKGQRQEMTARQIAWMLEGKVKRSVVKQPVMTTVYGVTHIGAREQIANALTDSGLSPIQIQIASRFLTNVVKQAIGERCDGARKIMDWLRACGRSIAKAGHTVRWTSPIGFPVEQQYRKTFIVRTVMGDLYPFGDDDPSLKPRVSKQVNSLPPNFIHSVDASHMMLTAIAARETGVAFTAVHDSYWTHAEDAGVLGGLIRDQFVAINEKPLLEVLRHEWTHTYGMEFPEPPARGNYDINSVLKAPYFFS